jgi:hypothetical protein
MEGEEAGILLKIWIGFPPAVLLYKKKRATAIPNKRKAPIPGDMQSTPGGQIEATRLAILVFV